MKMKPTLKAEFKPYKYRDCWVTFAHNHIGVKTHAKQREILTAMNRSRRLSIKSCHSSSKSFTAAVAAICFLATRRDSKVMILAPTYTHAKKNVFAEMRRMLLSTRGRRLGGALLADEWRLGDTHYAKIISPSDPQAAAGFHAHGGTLVIVDEANAKEITDELFESLQSLMNDDLCKTVLLANPIRPEGFFFNTFRSPIWDNITISHLDLPAWTGEVVDIPGLLSKDFVQDVVDEHGVDSVYYANRVCGQFTDRTTDGLLARSEVESMFTREWNPGKTNPSVLGVDLARDGDDESVVVGVRGQKITLVYRESITDDYSKLAARIVRYAREHQVETIAFDAIGVGAGMTEVLERVKPEGVRVMAVKINNKPTSPSDQAKYKTIRDKSYDNLAEFIKSDAVMSREIDRRWADRLTEELLAIKYEYPEVNSDHKVVGRKKHIREAIGRSPDTLDALALASYARTSTMHDGGVISKTAFSVKRF